VHVVTEDEILVDDMYSLYKELGIQFGLDKQNPQGSTYLKNYKVSMTTCEIHYMYYKRSIILISAGALKIHHQNLLMYD
jgi:hypothetical protein